MSGFLQRLGTRAVGQLSIAPRAQSMFEPPSAAAPEPMIGILASMSQRRGRDGGVEQQQAPASPTPRAPTAHSREPVGPNVIASDIAPPSDVTESPHFERAALPTRAGSPEVHERVMPAPMQDTNEHSALMQPAQRAAAVSVQPERTVAREPSSMPALVATQPLPVVVPRAGSASRPRVLAAQAELQSAEPVRVTIGRVEVRAMLTPPPQRAATRTAPPSLPLEEYLRNRGRA
jgi:hypothetical protein